MELQSIPTEPEPNDSAPVSATVVGILVGVGTFLMGVGTLLTGIADLT